MDPAPLRDMFFEECQDLLAALSDGLSQLAAGTGEDDTLNAVFRAVHSIKGGAAAFDMVALVGFAHGFETVLDALRAGRLALSGDLTPVLLRAADHLADQIDAARGGACIAPGRSDALLDDLARYLGQDRAAASRAADDADPGFTALPLDIFAPLPGVQDDPPPGSSGSLLPGNFAAPPPGPFGAPPSGSPDGAAQGSFCPALPAPPSGPPAGPSGELPADPSGDPPAGLSSPAPLPHTALDTTPGWPATARPDTAPPDTAPPDPGPVRAPGLRVDLDRVDRLINTVGELIINQAMIEQNLQALPLPAISAMIAHVDAYRLLARDVQDAVMAIRAQPVRPLFQRMARTLREAAAATGKPAQLITQGEETEIDKTLLDGLVEPLTHMIRNAVDHGLEPAAARLAAGKPAEGRLRLAAQHRAGLVEITLADDGAGLDRRRILARAVDRGLIPPGQPLTEAEIDSLLFLPGFSTADRVSSLSGRGVGLDVAQTAVAALGGRIGLCSVAGAGTTFTLSLPLTLAVMEGLVISVAGQTLVVPVTAVIETLQPGPADLHGLPSGNRVLALRGQALPMIDLAEALGLRPRPPGPPLLLLVETAAHARCALIIDAVQDQRQVVIKGLAPHYGRVPGIAAATVLGNGQVALILDVGALAAQHPAPCAA